MSFTTALYRSGPQCQALFRLCADNDDILRLETTDMSDPAENVAVNDTLAVRLLISRRDLKFNQEDVADRAGVSRAYVSDLERGKVDNPTLDVVTSLARVLQVRPEYLLGWSDDPLGEDRPGNVALGHATMEMVRVYLEIAQADLDAAHRQASPVANWGL